MVQTYSDADADAKQLSAAHEGQSTDAILVCAGINSGARVSKIWSSRHWHRSAPYHVAYRYAGTLVAVSSSSFTHVTPAGRALTQEYVKIIGGRGG